MSERLKVKLAGTDDSFVKRGCERKDLSDGGRIEGGSRIGAEFGELAAVREGPTALRACQGGTGGRSCQGQRRPCSGLNRSLWKIFLEVVPENHKSLLSFFHFHQGCCFLIHSFNSCFSYLLRYQYKAAILLLACSYL